MDSKEHHIVSRLVFFCGALAMIAVISVLSACLSQINPKADLIAKEAVHTFGTIFAFLAGHFMGHRFGVDVDHTHSYYALALFALLVVLGIIGFDWYSPGTPALGSSASAEAVHQIGSLFALITGHHVGKRRHR